MRRWSLLGAALLATVTILGGAPAAAAHAPTGCDVRWGSLPRQAPAGATAPLLDVRAGRHACYDRLVLDLAGPVAGYTVRYVDQVAEDGSGRPVPLRGGARLLVVVAAPAYDAGYRPTYQPTHRSALVDVTGWRTFRQVAWAGSFEGQTTLGLGVRARMPFRVFTLPGPGDRSRLVVDVAHRW